MDVVAELSPLFLLRDTGFLWDGTSGIAGEIVDRLIMYRLVLVVLLRFASTGFPAQNDLCEVFSKLQQKYKVLEESGRPVPNMCTDAAIEFRGMFRQFYDFKKAGKVIADISEMIDAVVLPDASSPGAIADSSLHMQQPRRPQLEQQSRLMDFRRAT